MGWFAMRGAIFLVLVVLTISAQKLVAEEANTIRVLGKRPERERQTTEGSITTYTPRDASQYSTSAQLKGDSSMQTTRTSRISPSGFSAPRFRGQDARVSEIYLQDQLLQDPYASLPFSEDLDLRAFGELTVYQGVSPPEQTTTNPLGSAVYRFTPVTKSHTTLGVQYGQPFGWSGFGQGQYLMPLSGEAETLCPRFFVRGHSTQGKYRYYDDSGTPFNADDDRHLWRKNNAQKNFQAIPYLEYNNARHKISYYGLFYRSRRGIPQLRNPSADNHAFQTVNGAVQDAQWQYDLQPNIAFLPDVLAFEMQLQTEKRATQDDTQIILLSTEENTLRFDTSRGIAFLEWDKPWVYLKTQAQVAQSKIRASDSKSAQNLARNAQSYYGGARFKLPFVFSLSGKYQQKFFSDHWRGERENANTGLTHNDVGKSVVLAWEARDLSLYTQWGTFDRSPSLLEEFGDASTILPNERLEAEKTKHREVGLALSLGDGVFTFSTAYFQDRTEEKIVFVPAINNASKAVNLATTSINGFEIQAGLKPRATTRFLASATRLWPRDLSSENERQQIPGVAERYYAFSLAQDISDFTWHWVTYYRGRVYRDIRNNIELPGVWISDTALDYVFKTTHRYTWSCGLNVNNVFAVEKIPTQSADGSEHGYTSYSEVSGQPLPGRNFQTTLTASF